MLQRAKQKIRTADSKTIQEFIIDFIVKIYDQVAVALPQVGFKEIYIG